MTVKLTNGDELELNDKLLDDMETIDLVAEIDGGEIVSLSRLCSRIFSTTDKKKLYESCRDANGIVKPENVMQEIISIIGQAGSKN